MILPNELRFELVILIYKGIYPNTLSTLTNSRLKLVIASVYFPVASGKL
jgi:hypothetical protein